MLNFLLHQWDSFRNLLRSSFKDLVPILSVIVIFQIGVFESVPENWQATLMGLLVVGVGLALFLQGLELGIFPLGESLSNQFAQKGSLPLMLTFGFAVGYTSAIAEPALAVIADKAMLVSEGRLSAWSLRQVVAVAAGTGVALGVYRIIVGHAIAHYLIVGYLITIGISYFTPEAMLGLSYDLGGVTTSTVTVPLVAALGIGLATYSKGRNPIADGFGLVAFAAMTPILFVQVYGIYAFNFATTQQTLLDVKVISAPPLQSFMDALASCTECHY